MSQKFSRLNEIFNESISDDEILHAGKHLKRERKQGLIVLQEKFYFFKWVQPAVRHMLTYIKMFVSTCSLRKPMLTTWHFGAGGDILGQIHKTLPELGQYQ